MKRFLLSILMVVTGLTAFSQSPGTHVTLTPAYPMAIGKYTIDGCSFTNGVVCMEDVPLDSLPRYEIEEIGPQTIIDRENGIAFYVTADSLNWSNVFFDYYVGGDIPKGVVKFNRETGLFNFFPSEEECKSFIVTFIASNGTEEVTEDVLFTLAPITPSETNAFNTAGMMPKAEDLYTIVVTDSSKTMILNNQERTVRSVSIAGKDVVFDDSVENKVRGLNGCEDIYELNVYAERMIVRSELNFPQTNITIYARDLMFEDKGNDYASINTTPSSFGTLTDGRGNNGVDAGDITLYIKNFKADKATRFILNGAVGQSTNRNGRPGYGGCGGLIRSTIDVGSFCEFKGGDGGNKCDVAGDGSADAITILGTGIPGGPGRLELIDDSFSYLHPYYISAVMRHANDAFINNQRDYVLQTCREYHEAIDGFIEAGLNNNEESHDSENQQGIDESFQSETHYDLTYLIENPSFETGNLNGWVFYKGSDTGAKNKTVSNSKYAVTGMDGQYVFNTWNKTAPSGGYYLQQTLRSLPAGTYNLEVLFAAGTGVKISLSANDNVQEFTMANSSKIGQECNIIFKLEEEKDVVIKARSASGFRVDNFRLFLTGVEYPIKKANPTIEVVDRKFELQNLAMEMDEMLLKLERGLDYFGNSVGWVPMLSFEVLLANYENEINRAMPIFYTHYWLTEKDKALENHIKASEKAAILAEQALGSNQKKFNSLVKEIPNLETEAKDITDKIDNLTKRITKLENKLLKKAKKKVKRRNRWKKIFGIAKAVANVALQFVPGGTVASVALNAAASLVNWNSDVAIIGQIKDQSETANVGNVIQDVVNAGSGNYLSTLISSYETLQKSMSPLVSSISNLYSAINRKTTSNSEVKAEYNRLIASSKSWKKMTKEVEQLSNQKIDLTNHIDQTFSDMTATASDMTSNVLALDAFKRDVFNGNSKRDLNAMIYIDKMRQNEKERLLKYHYYLRKAYEYRLLKPYEGDYNLVDIFDRLEKQAKLDESMIINKDNYEALSSVFKDEISKITNDMITEYLTSNTEKHTTRYIEITKEQLDAINTLEEGITINFHEMGGVFSDTDEDVRIVDISVDSLVTHVIGNVGQSGSMDLYMTHSGISQFRKDGKLYWFDHKSRNAKTDNPHTWGVTYNVKGGKINPIQHSDASLSLLYSLLDKNGYSDKIMLFSRPSAWSDITISKEVIKSSDDADIVIDKLVLKLEYDYIKKPASSTKINIDITANEQLLPYITCSRADLNGRSSGRGNLYRSYEKNSGNVTFTAVDQYEMYHFVNWTDRNGRVRGTSPALNVETSQDQFLIANYEWCGPVLSVPDTIFISNAAGSRKVKVRNIGYKDSEMDWIVCESDTDSWDQPPADAMKIELGDDAEGFNDGSFTFSYDANKTGKERIGQIEIFAPETDEFVKTIYIVQTDAYKKGDVNHDGKVDISDIVAVVNTMAGKTKYLGSANVNEDDDINISDVVSVINIMVKQ